MSEALPWSAVASERQADAALRELVREVGRRHVLRGRLDGAQALRVDDGLFRFADGTLAGVPPRWSGRTERVPLWPATRLHAPLDAWARAAAA